MDAPNDGNRAEVPGDAGSEHVLRRRHRMTEADAWRWVAENRPAMLAWTDWLDRDGDPLGPSALVEWPG